MIYSFSNFEIEAGKIKEWFSRELDGLRTGRANPTLVKDIVVEYYGTKTKLEGLASIGVQDARTLVIQPWDKQAIEAIEKAIRSSNIGLQPVVDKEMIRVVLPELTGERRQFLTKIVGEKFEEARVSLRKARDDVWKDIQNMERESKLSEDEKFRLKDELQKKMDSVNEALQGLAERKKEEIMK
ncbi:MAG: ribosome recycling factor [Patescibacteria group bacterium]